MNRLSYLHGKAGRSGRLVGLLPALILGGVGCSDDNDAVDCVAQPALCHADATMAKDTRVGADQGDSLTRPDLGTSNDVGTTNDALQARADGTTADDASENVANDAGQDAVAAGDTTEGYTNEDVTVQQVHEWIESGFDMTLIDIRGAGEYGRGHVPSAINIRLSHDDLQTAVDAGKIPRDKPVVVYCTSGTMSEKAATLLTDSGYRPVYDMYEAYGGWVAAGYEVETN